MNGLPYYKAYPRDFIEGTIGMSFELKAAYRLVIDMIYMQGGNLPDDARYVSGLLGCSIRKWKALRSDLLEAGKLYVSGEFLRNKRADKEVETLSKHQEKQAENASGPRKNKGLEKPPLNHTEPEPERNTEPNGSDAKASPVPVGEDARKALFSEALPVLARYTGKPDSALRPLIGKWLKKSGDDARRLVVLIAQSVEERRAEPIAWIEGCLKQSGHAKGKFVIKANGSVHKQDEHTGEWWECHGIEAHQVERIAVRDLRNREAA